MRFSILLAMILSSLFTYSAKAELDGGLGECGLQLVSTPEEVRLFASLAQNTKLLLDSTFESDDASSLMRLAAQIEAGTSDAHNANEALKRLATHQTRAEANAIIDEIVKVISQDASRAAETKEVGKVSKFYAALLTAPLFYTFARGAMGIYDIWKDSKAPSWLASTDFAVLTCVSAVCMFAVSYWMDSTSLTRVSDKTKNHLTKLVHLFTLGELLRLKHQLIELGLFTPSFDEDRHPNTGLERFSEEIKDRIQSLELIKGVAELNKDNPT